MTVYTLSYPAVSILPEGFTHLPEWKIPFYIILVLIAFGGWFFSKEETAKVEQLGL